MEALARLGGSIAHDIRNHLTVIKGFAEILQRMALVSGDGGDMLAEILIATGRAEAVTAKLLAFSRKGMLYAEVVDLSDTVRDLRGELGDALGPAVRLHVVCESGRQPVWVEPNELRQTVMRLARNSAEAMPDGGELRITVRPADDASTVARRHEGFQADRAVVLEVADTGTGMDAETASKAFEPFFSTKPAGEGLGLAMAYGFIRQSGGAVEVSSVPGKGTTVWIFLPVAADE